MNEFVFGSDLLQVEGDSGSPCGGTPEKSIEFVSTHADSAKGPEI